MAESNRRINLLKIPPGVLRQFAINDPAHFPDFYFVKNPIVRYIAWQRISNMISLCNPDAFDKVLDLGCGGGVTLPTLANSFKEVHGIDLDISASEKILAKYGLTNVTLIQGDFIDISLQSDQYDAVIAADVVEHIPDLRGVVLKMFRILKEGGILSVSLPVENNFFRIAKFIAGRASLPSSHCHSSVEVEAELSHHFVFVQRAFVPVRCWGRLALFRVLKYKKPQGLFQGPEGY